MKGAVKNTYFEIYSFYIHDVHKSSSKFWPTYFPFHSHLILVWLLPPLVQ